MIIVHLLHLLSRHYKERWLHRKLLGPTGFHLDVLMNSLRKKYSDGVKIAVIFKGVGDDSDDGDD